MHINLLAKKTMIRNIIIIPSSCRCLTYRAQLALRQPTQTFIKHYFRGSILTHRPTLRKNISSHAYVNRCTLAKREKRCLSSLTREPCTCFKLKHNGTEDSHNQRRLYSKNSESPKNIKESKWLTIPNVLTGFRLAIAPYICYLVLTQDFTSALGLFVLAGATDGIDGWIARNFKGQSSIVGSYIDPLADKVLVSVLTFSLAWVNIIPVSLCGVIITRDVMIMSTAAHFHYKHLEPPKTMERFFDFENSKVQMEPTLISKYNTFLQLGLVALSITAPVVGFVNHPYLQAYWYLVASTTVLSGLSYVVKDKSSYFVK